MLIRRETADDVKVVTDVIDAAFALHPGAEAWLVAELRDSDAWIPGLSMVAEVDGEVVGHVLCTRARVGSAPVLGLAPLSVRPDVQGRGIGSALVHAVLGAADVLDEALVGLLGDPRYYGRFGFRAAEEVGVVPPNPLWGEHFQVRGLHRYSPNLRGDFRYAEPFERL